VVFGKLFLRIGFSEAGNVGYYDQVVVFKNFGGFGACFTGCRGHNDVLDAKLFSSLFC